MAHPARGERAQQHRRAGEEPADRTDDGRRHRDPDGQCAQGEPQGRCPGRPGRTARGTRRQGQQGGGGTGVSQRRDDLRAGSEVGQAHGEAEPGQGTGTGRGDRHERPGDPPRGVSGAHGEDREQHALGAAVLRGGRDQGPDGTGPEHHDAHRVGNVSSAAVLVRTGHRRHPCGTHPAPRTPVAPDLRRVRPPMASPARTTRTPAHRNG